MMRSQSCLRNEEGSWVDPEAIFGTRDYPSRCQCQRFKIRHFEWRSVPVEARATRLREQTDWGNPRARKTSGLLAYLNGETAGWCAVGPARLSQTGVTLREVMAGY
jgi:hypothetical protein